MHEIGRDSGGVAGPFVDSRYFLAPAGGAGWLIGVWLAAALDLSALLCLLAAVPLLFGAAVFWRRGRVGLLLASLALAALGGARYAAAQPPFDPGQLHYYNGAKDVVIRGRVNAEPTRRDTTTELRVAVTELALDGQWRPVEGLALVRAGRFPAIPYGATLELAGDLETPLSLGSPGYAAYLERQGVAGVVDFPSLTVTAEGGGSPIYRTLLRVKERGRQSIAASLLEPHASLLTGILLGDDSGMPRALDDAFRETGMTHIIAISGFNIAVLIFLMDKGTALLFPRRKATLLIMLFIALYAVLVGAGASVVRASIMGVAYLAGRRLLGRPTLVVAGLFTAAFLMTAAQPNALWDVGFQLSFAATLGLILYATPWTRWMSNRLSPRLPPQARGHVIGFTSEALVVTLAAQLLTLPLILYHFGRLSLASLPANLLVLPAQPGVMVTGGMTLFLGLLSPAAGQAAGWLSWLFLHYSISMIRLLAQMPAASVDLPLSAGGLVVVYLLIAAVTLLPAARAFAREKAPERSSLGISPRAAATVGCMALLGLLLLAANRGRADGRLHVAFLDVGQGDAIFIQTPNGRQMLIDGGRYPSVILDQVGRQMPFWDRSIDLVIATHPDDDHVAGLVDVLERYEVGGLITNGASPDADTAYAELLHVATERGAAVHPARAGEAITLDEGVQLEVLHAGPVGASDNRNEASIVGLLTYGRLSILLTGDAEEAAEAAMLQRGALRDTVVLKAGHHGANTSSGAPFLAAVSPSYVVISAGVDNTYGHPHPAMLERVAAVGATVLRTDELGTVEVVTDGERMWWEAKRVSAAAVP